MSPFCPLYEHTHNNNNYYGRRFINLTVQVLWDKTSNNIKTGFKQRSVCKELNSDFVYYNDEREKNNYGKFTYLIYFL